MAYRKVGNIVVNIPKDAFTEEAVRKAIANGIVPKNAISWASENGHTELVKDLIALGAKVFENYNYPLELASREGHFEIVKMLIDAGAKTYDSPGDEGYSLRMAASRGHTSIVKLLIEAGANPVADKYKALELALSNKHYGVVEILLDAINEVRQNRQDVRKKGDNEA